MLQFLTSSLSLVFFLLPVSFSCASDPDHAPPRAEAPIDVSTSRKSQDFRLIHQNRAIFLLLASPTIGKVLFIEFCQEPPCQKERQNLLLEGTFVPNKTSAEILRKLKDDSRMTGELSYFFHPYSMPYLNNSQSPVFEMLKRGLRGSIFRGNEAEGGSLLVKDAFVSSLKVQALRTKRPVPTIYKDWCFFLFPLNDKILGIPVYTSIDSYADILELRMLEARMDRTLLSEIKAGSWAIFKPELNDGPVAKPIKIRLKGKFYHGVIEILAH